MVFAIHWHESTMDVHVFPMLNPPPYLPLYPIPQGHPSAPGLSTLSHASNLDWWSVSHMIIYMFQCNSLKSSHPHLLPQNPKDCSVHLCLFCCLTYRVIITIFLNGWWNSSWAISNPERWCCESVALNMPANLENSAVATGLEEVSFHSNPKER